MGLMALKLAVTIAIVIGLALIAERASPRLAGLVAGYPLGTAIVLFFLGLEQGPVFAATSAVYAIAGLSATFGFLYAYYLATRGQEKVEADGKTAAGGKHAGLIRGPLAAMAAFFSLSALLNQIGMTRTLAVLLTVSTAWLAVLAFRAIADGVLIAPVRLSLAALAVRAVLAAVTVLAITGLALALGPDWSGLLAGFPITLFPLLLIIHFQYGRQPVHAIIRNFPYGAGAIIIHALTVSFTYPALGIAAGTAAAFAAASLYLAAALFLSANRGRRS